MTLEKLAAWVGFVAAILALAVILRRGRVA